MSVVACWGSTTILSAQTPSVDISAQSMSAQPRSSTFQQSQEKIRLSAKDRPLKEVLQMLGKKSGYPIVFDNTNPKLAQRITVNIVDMTVAEALATVLKGTGLVSSIGPDGRTIVIVSSDDQKGKSEKNADAIIGVIVDSATKKAISGATVLVSGTRLGATTRDDGRFRFANVPAGQHSIVARLLGYQTRTVAVTVSEGDTVQVTIALRQTSTSLTEVVTTAMGKQRRIDISNDVVSINADKLLQTAPIRNVTDLLVAAQVPGMVITKSSGDPNAPTRIRFGGPGSISQNNDPVVIIDGIWIKSSFSTPDIERGLSTLGKSDRGENADRFLAGGSQYTPSRLDELDPSTIETIEIVRGPAAATLYGPDAANGVIRITTKRGRSGPTRWDIRAVRNVGSPLGGKPLQYQGWGHTTSSTEQVDCPLYLLGNGLCAAQDSLVILDPNDPFVRPEGNTFTNDLSLTVSGGTAALTYSITGGIQDITGPRRFSGAEMVRFRQIGIPFAGKMQYPSQVRNRSLSTRMGIQPRQGLNISLDFMGSQRGTRENNAIIDFRTSITPRDTLTTLIKRAPWSQGQNNTAVAHGTVSAAATWNPWSWMTANMSLGVDRTYTDETSKRILQFCGGGNPVCDITATEEASAPSQSSVYSSRIQSSFLPNLGWISRFIAVRPGVAFDLRRDLNTNSAATVILTPVNGEQDSRSTIPRDLTTALAGLSVNAYITLFDRISFDPGFRRDFATSRTFRNNAKSYPRFGTSWLVSDESFFPKTQFITLLRLRGALGYAAVQPDITAVNGGYTGGTTTVNGQTVPIVRFNRIGNARLSPERSFEIETGFDADLFGDRITLTVTHSNKKNINTLIDRVLAPSSGVMNTRQENVARIQNRQTTMQLMTQAIDLQTLSLRLGANVAVFDNKVKSLGRNVSPFGPGEQRYVANYPVGGVWAKQMLAVRDINQNGIIDPFSGEFIVSDTMIYLGTNIPRYTIGYNIELGLFRKLMFSTNLDYAGRTMQVRSSATGIASRGTYDPTASIQEQILAVGSLTGALSATDYQSISSLRWASASLTFDIPLTWLRVLRARSAQLSLQGSNLGLWTHYRGRDPGVNSTPIGERTTDYGDVLGIPRSYVFQLRVGY